EARTVPIPFGTRYALLDELGRGGMGNVYRARYCPEPGGAWKEVALKRIRPDRLTTEMIDYFKRERESIIGLRHPHIVQVLDWNTQDDQPFYAMNLVRGGQPLQTGQARRPVA